MINFGHKYKNVIFILLVCTTFPSGIVHAKNLSCEMQNMLITTTAIARDQGKSKSMVIGALKKGGDLTKSEIISIVEIVFDTLKSSSPSEISRLHQISCR